MAGRAVQALTKRLCEAAQPLSGVDGKRSELILWDATVKGFGLRVSAGGARSFILIYRAGRGRGAPSRKVTIGRYGSPHTVETARKEARRILGLVADGQDPAGEASEQRRAKAAGRAPKGSVGAAIEEWLERDQAGNRSAAQVRRVLDRNVMPLWRNRPLSDIRKRDVIAIMDAMADRGAPVQANRVLAYLKRFFRWAAGRDLIETNPAQFVEKPAPETQRDRVLTDAELVEVWRAAERMGGPFGNGIRLLMLTAARLREIFNATWDEVDVGSGTMKLAASRSKSGSGREIPLNAPALAILAAMPRFASGRWLITLNGERPYSGFSHAKAALDTMIRDVSPEPLAPWTLHDLRRTVATGLQRQGARLEVIEAVLGHVSGSRAGIVGTYQRHRFRDEARAAMDAWGRHVDGLVSSTSSNVTEFRRQIPAGVGRG